MRRPRRRRAPAAALRSWLWFWPASLHPALPQGQFRPRSTPRPRGSSSGEVVAGARTGLRAGSADGAGQPALGAADLADDHVLARSPGSLVGVDVGFGQVAGVELGIQVAGQPGLAAQPGLAGKGGAARPVVARYAEHAVDLPVVRLPATNCMSPGDSVWQRIEALARLQAEHRGTKRMTCYRGRPVRAVQQQRTG